MSIVAWVNQNQGFVTAVLTLVYVVATIAILLTMSRANALSLQNMSLLRDIETSRLRPYITFDIEIKRNLVSCLLRNDGLTAAFAVRVELAPKVAGLIGGRPRDSALTTRLIESLRPRGELREALDVSHDFMAQYPNPIFRGKVRYRDAAGTSYVDPLVVDLTAYQHMLWADEPDFIIAAPKLERAIKEAAQHALRARQ